jgi:transposase InsO family protein
MKLLTNIDISQMLKDIPHFRGVYTRDMLPKRILKEECGVINTDTINGTGKHWICYYNELKSKYVEFFDSFGLPPAQEILTYLETSGKDILYNSSQLQANDSTKCGYYCVYFIKERNKGKSIYDILYFFKQHPDITNERKIIVGTGLSNKERDLLNNLYYDPKMGYSGLKELSRKSKLPQTKVKEFLEQQNTYTLHKPIKKKFETRKVYVHGIDNQWQADLVEMQEFSKENEGLKYLLTIIDCFSKYAWAIPIKDKTADQTIEAFNNIFKQRKPLKLQTDKGKEFINKKFQELLKRNNIHWFSTNSDLKASIVERFNRTLKTKMWKYFTQIGTRKWIDIVDDLVYNYNNSYHRSIKMTPVEGSKKENESIVYKNLYRESKLSKKSNKFKVGDKVRISKWKGTFEKGYLPNWTRELFTVSKVLNTSPTTYKIEDYNDEEIEGSFYEPELVKFDKQDEVYEVEKILKTRIKNGEKEYLVSWRSYGPEYNSWIPAENLKN